MEPLGKIMLRWRITDRHRSCGFRCLPYNGGPKSTPDAEGIRGQNLK